MAACVVWRVADLIGVVVAQCVCVSVCVCVCVCVRVCVVVRLLSRQDFLQVASYTRNDIYEKVRLALLLW